MATLIRATDCYVFAFEAMASPCEVRIETDDADLARKLGEIVQAEAARIEKKFSRYRPDSTLSRINGSAGEPMTLDEETSSLLDLAAQCHDLSEGRFDLTSGVLRRVWRFDGSDRVPAAEDVAKLLPLIGWSKISWQAPILQLPVGMEIDLGGIGKEYAVDSAAQLIQAARDVPALVNFGGDLRATRARADGARWGVEIESVDASRASEGMIALTEGAIATSGDARRFLEKDGVRYSHILDPRTGWPVVDPPRSVTVAAPTCMEAGLLSTLAMLHGKSAEQFLDGERALAWIVR